VRCVINYTEIRPKVGRENRIWEKRRDSVVSLGQHAPPGRAGRIAIEPAARRVFYGGIMLLIREIMYCKPGKVRPMVEKFLAMSKLSEKLGMGKMRVLTDLSAERYWTIVSEMEVPNLKTFEEMFQGQGQNEGDMKEFENIMKGYHDLVEYGRREIYNIEG
jgi:hypothetical protein